MQEAHGSPASQRPPSHATLSWAAQLGDPRDHSKSARADFDGSAPWLPPGKNDYDRLPPSLKPKRPHTARPASCHGVRSPPRPQSAFSARAASSRRMSVNSARPPAQAQGKEIVEPALSYGEMSELVWRLRVENEELRKGQSSQEDVAAKVHAAESSLRAEMDALRAELTEEQSRTASIEADNRELFAENNRLQDRLHALDNEAAKERRLRQRLEGELRSMTSRAEDLEVELDALRSKRDQIASKLADTERMLAGEQRENELMLRAAAEAEFKKRLKEVEDWKTRQAFRRPRPKNAGSSATARSRFPQQKSSPRVGSPRSASASVTGGPR